MKCYFDGSKVSGPDGHWWLTLAGFTARDDFWNRFEKEWNSEVLHKREPHAPYLHMTDLLTGNKVFTGWAVERRQALVMDALDYLQSCPKLAFEAVVCTIDTTAREKLLEEGYEITDPHVVCGQCALGAAFSWCYEHYPEGIELAHVYFDRSERFMHPLHEQWQRKKKEERSSTVITDCFWGLIMGVDDCEMDKTPALQAADLLAWATSRQHSKIERPYLYLAEIMKKVIPHSWFTLDENTLRSVHKNDFDPERAE
jgi:hypothetical protein